MKTLLLVSAILSATTRTVCCFQAAAYPRRSDVSPSLALFSSTTPYTTDVSAAASPKALAKQQLLSTCERLKSANGVFLVDKSSREKLMRAISDLQRTVTNVSMSRQQQADLLIGDWTLLCTTIVAKNDNALIDSATKIPDFLAEPINKVKSRLSNLSNKYFKVQQRIRTNEMSNHVTRVDHVIEYVPPQSLKELVQGTSVPDVIAKLNLNPLQVSKSKLVLIHKASQVPSDGSSNSNNISIQLSLQSVVVNVAGTSSMLNPMGQDLAALQIPSIFSDMARGASDSFETVYLDDTLRVSKSRQLGGRLEQWRVFVRQASVGDEFMRTDVDDSVDPEFVYEDEQDDSSAAAANGDQHEGQDDVSPSDY
ncbi:hypothetical protein MPSEU_000060500 [Mayamaea pseudoterrestris]|nr:hypothetical protein MPSEU_000060500 [Mayamaea pseudoterrestris]